MSLENCRNFVLNLSVDEMDGAEKHFYRFKSFRLDVGERQLLRHGEVLQLTPKAFDVLAMLVERNGHLVEKEELLQTVWAGSFVEETNITRIIHTLRKVLGEDDSGNKFIETVPKKGYRFVAKVTETQPKNVAKSATAIAHFNEPVETHADAGVFLPRNEDPDITDQTAREPAFWKRRALLASGIGITVLLIILVSINFRTYFLFHPEKPKSIAVLPLKPISTDVRNELYEIGIAESLIQQLGAMKGFIVRPLSATRSYLDIDQDPIAAGLEQKTDYVLASNYQIAEGKIRVTALLLNVATGQIEETYKIERPADGIFAVQDAMAGEIGRKMVARFSVATVTLKAKRGTASEEAYRLYLQGMFLADGRSPADARKAVEILEEAVRLDPNYAQAWAGKAYAHRVVSNFGRDSDTHGEYRKSIEAVNKALALDANLAVAYSVLCENKMYYEYHFDDAETACRRAVELNPDTALAHQIYARFLNSRGRYTEAIAEIKTAIDIEPASLYNQRLLGNSLQYARQYEETAAQLKRVVEMDKNFGTTYYWLSQTLAFQGKEAEAFEWWMKNLERSKADDEIIRAFQTAFRTQGWLGVLRERAARFERGNEIYFHGAAYNAMIGNRDKAFEYLEKSFARREWGLAYLQVDPRFDALRDDPRFIEMVRRVEKN